ncbi:hypothetical protein [Levilactobacillus brevis]|uniref:hypothetical protein n=1 Tax=Levilactobacillus brevis TaxID=1580 RepID=UPI0035A378C7
MKKSTSKWMKTTFHKLWVFIYNVLLYLEPEAFKNSELERFRHEQNQIAKLSDTELEANYVECNVKLTKQKGYMTLWVSCIFTAIFTDFSHSISTWVALLATQIYGSSFLKDMNKLSETDKLFSEFISMTFWGAIILFIVIFFIAFLKTISITKRKLLIYRRGKGKESEK